MFHPFREARIRILRIRFSDVSEFWQQFFLLCAFAVEEFVAGFLGAYDLAEYSDSERYLQIWSCKRLQGDVHFSFLHSHLAFWGVNEVSISLAFGS